MEQRAPGTLRVWAEPFTPLRLPKLFDLRADPYERADITSNTYYDWFISQPYLFFAGQAADGKVPGDLQGVPTPPAGRELQHRPGDGEDEAIARPVGVVRPAIEMRVPTMALRSLLRTSLSLVAVMIAAPLQAADDPLPSWSDGPVKRAIVRFVGDVTGQGGPDFVPVEERVAAFDNDGTLWSEQPYYNQVAFALDRVKALAGQHPEWKEKPPFRYVLDGDLKAILAGTPRDRLELLAASHAGMTSRGVRSDRRGLDRDGPASAIPSAVHGAGLSADAGVTRLLAATIGSRPTSSRAAASTS